MGSATSLYHLLDERPELVAVVKGRRDVSDLDVRELVRRQGGVVKLIDRRARPGLPGVSLPRIRRVPRGEARRLFPTDAMRRRLAQVEVAELLWIMPALDAFGG